MPLDPYMLAQTPVFTFHLGRRDHPLGILFLRLGLGLVYFGYCVVVEARLELSHQPVGTFARGIGPQTYVCTVRQTNTYSI